MFTTIFVTSAFFLSHIADGPQVRIAFGNQNATLEARAKERGFVLGGHPVKEISTCERCDLEDKELEFLVKFPELELLDLHDNPKLTDTALKVVGKLKTLKTLVLSGNKKIGDSGMVFLRDLKQLGALDIRGTTVTEKGLKELTVHTRLNRLDLRNSRVSKLNDLRAFRNLEVLELDGLKLDEKEIQQVFALAGLKYLILPDTTRDESLKGICELANLEVLFLEGSGVTDIGLEYLRELTKLRTLRVGGSKISGEGFSALVKLPNLTWLGVEELSLSETACKHIGQLKNLQVLRLTESGVGDKEV